MEFSTARHLCVHAWRIFWVEVRQTHPDYYVRPVPSFGDAQARLLMQDWRPGMHGAESAQVARSLVISSGKLLYSTLHSIWFCQSTGALEWSRLC
ncbi:MAG: hypothetical protein IPN81_12840 [Nitrosomonadales bacterium]|nr:hypothetical protein [Nitrosomonadales bacterium]